MHNIIHDDIVVVLPYIISILEILGIFVVTQAAVYGFWQYIQNTFMKKKIDIQTILAKGLATGLEFKMAAEILKTVIIQSLDELYVLGAVILLRAVMSVLIHFEIKNDHHIIINKKALGGSVGNDESEEMAEAEVKNENIGK